jgi:oxepin-CoA hydrolase/3-oxo-5,6-dehydrosuberyl-CoA semialdehyde dehydrogenase
MTKEILLQRLQKLSLQSEAKFGILTPQHMVEHLIITVKLSSGRIPIPSFEPNEKQLARKQALLFTDMPFPQGVKAPGLPDTLLELRYPDLETAKSALIAGYDAYQLLYKENPTGFGLLNYEEWERFHAKHIDHHLGQFGC